GLFGNKLIEVVEAPGREASGLADETMRQGAPAFGFDSTVRETPDDTSLLVSSEGRLLSYRDVVKPTVAQLVLTTGETAGTVFPLIDSEYLLGRHRESSIPLADPGVSGFHARIYRGPDGYAVEDLKSRNGTWVNGERIFHAVLSHGDQVRLGASELRYEVLFRG
ncbi:MAG: FHA domain-containing protein, partial [Acidobacteriota bacterium]